jgi:hypothetical protein
MKRTAEGPGSSLDQFMTGGQGAQMVGMKTTGPDGLYEWNSLAEGGYQLVNQQMTSGMGIFRLGMKFDLRAGEVKTVNLGDGLGGSSLSGRVLDAAGKPISEGVVITLSPLFDWEYTDFGATGEQGGAYAITGLRDGPYEASLLRVTLGGDTLYSNRKERVEIAGATVKDFVFGEQNKVTMTLTFGEGVSEAARARYKMAVIRRAGSDESTGESVSEYSFCMIQGDKLSFEGVFRGEYELVLMALGGTDKLEAPGTILLDNVAGDQDVGVVEVRGE